MTIKITVKTRHIAEQSDPKNHRFVFAYSINIENQSDQPVQLLNRYWLITDANGKKVEVQGAGVVGEQPTIEPDKSYSYTSGCILETELGTMEGHYEFQHQDKSLFKQTIPVFRLSLPNIVH
ncbi:MAG: Co2+/Mg2+ efflux protein ApaG [Gammaproteobacteria bacterium]|nr:Co2+/Mg2+ efflux protein ApaG [Gammaproteobacteria bacterium]